MENTPPPLDYISIAMHLLQMTEITLSETMSETQKDFPALLCREVTLCAHGHMSLLVTERSDLYTPPSPPASQAEYSSLYVQYGRKIYGTLIVTLSQVEPVIRHQALEGARVVAKVCGWILHVFELSSLVLNLSATPNPLTVASLTPRQHEVLTLICQGYTLPEIARLLGIEVSTTEKHRQQIYAKLEARDEQEALITAYRVGLFSPLSHKQNEP